MIGMVEWGSVVFGGSDLPLHPEPQAEMTVLQVLSDYRVAPTASQWHTEPVQTNLRAAAS